MPVYEYKCEDGHIFERLRSMSSREDDMRCPECQKPAHMLLSAPAPPQVQDGTPKHH